jgi:sulfide dehydrogenase cytochrome subunit
MINHLRLAGALISAIIGCTYSVVALADTSSNVHIRSLAASCAACHGTQGNTLNVPGQKNLSGKAAKLAGMNADYLSQQLFDFRSGKRTGTVMNHHANGLNDAEIKALGLYFSSKKHHTVTLPRQTLQKTKAH